MVHASTSLWEDRVPPAAPVPEWGADALNLFTRPLASRGHFEVQVARGDWGRVGFEVLGEPLIVTSVSKEMKDQTPMADGDIIVAVDSARVATLAEYEAATQGLQEFRITLKAKDPDDPAQHPVEDSNWCTAVEFDIVEVIATEDMGSIRAALRRIGDLSGRLEWGWCIENGDVVENIFQKIKRTAGSGTVVFEDGESTAYITLAVPEDPTWNVEALYFVHLKDQQHTTAAARAILGDIQTLYVYSVNLKSFPANAYGSLDAEPLVPSMRRLIWCFWEHNYTEIPRETKWGLFYSLIPPSLAYLTQIQQRILVDCGLVVLRGDDVSREEKCMLWGSVDISPAVDIFNALTIVAVSRMIILTVGHLVFVRKRMLRLGGKAAMRLRANMFSTMLQLSENSRDSFDDGDIQKALDTEVDLAIRSVWTRLFDLVQELFDLATNTALTLQVVLSIRSDWSAAIILCIPLMMASLTVVFLIRGRTQFLLRHQASVADENWSAFVAMCSACNSLILLYRRGWYFTKCFRQCHAEFNKKNYNATAYSGDTLWILKYAFAMLSTLVVCAAGLEVQRGMLSVGGFLILIAAVEGFGTDLHSLASIVNDMVVGSAAVGKLASVLNSETRRAERCKRQRLDDETKPRSPAGLSIDLERVSFSYAASTAVPPLNMSIQAGQLVCFPLGKKSSLGTNTLFKLISGFLLPTKGHILVPNRWRIIYVPVVPVIFDGTLMYNLMFSERSRLHSRDAVYEICGALGMSSHLLFNDDYDVGSNGCCLKFSDRVIISITRALLHDVDLLLISSALDVLGETHALKVLRYLAQYTKHRGMPEEVLPKHLRHMKTVLYTTKFAMLQRQAAEVVVFPDDVDGNDGRCKGARLMNLSDTSCSLRHTALHGSQGAPTSIE